MKKPRIREIQPLSLIGDMIAFPILVTLDLIDYMFDD